MLETATTDIELYRAYNRAHSERAAAFALLFRRVGYLFKWSYPTKKGTGLLNRSPNSNCPA